MAKKLVVFMLVLAMVLIPFVGCAPAEGTKKALIGVAMPTKSLQRWNEDGAYLKKLLEEKGYEVDLQYAENKPDVQANQIENMVTNGCKVLVVASIDSTALAGVLADAKKSGISVIAYDRLLMDTENCDYYATFDNYAVGQMQGEFIESTLKLKDGVTGPFTMECFGGSPDDNNAYLFNQGAMDVLQKYIDSGVLVVKSGQTAMDIINIPKWDSGTAQDRMDNLLTANYADENIDVVLSPNDSLAQGIVASLKQAGYSTDASSSKPFPILTGQDCDKINVGQIIRGEQSMSILKDTRVLAAKTVEMVQAIVDGKTVPTNTTYNNKVKDVASYNCEIQFANKDNWHKLLIESGYYKEEDIKP